MAEDPEALRRRLYRPGASEDDRVRYLATLPVPAREPETVPAPSRRRRLPVVLPVIVLAVAVAGAVLVGRAAPRPVAAAPSAVAPAVEPTPKTILPSRQVVVAMNGLPQKATRIVGSGSADVPLDVTAAPASGGRLVVLLSSADERPVGWRALRLETQRDPIPFEALVAAQPPRDRQGATRADAVPYTGAPPIRLRVEAPADSIWTLTVAFDGP